MKVFMASAANLGLEEKYLNLAKDVSEVFAKNNFDLLFGAANYSMMGECYKTFVKYKRKIYAYTVPKYEKDFKKLKEAKCIRVNDTLIRFQKFYFKSDYIVILPGGIGTLAEFCCAVEEFRASGGDKKIILVNYEGYYDDFINWMNKNIESKFFAESLRECYEIVNDANDIEKLLEKNK